jgi:hypothetical protein
MKKLFFTIITTVSFLISLLAQNTQGIEFWLTFGKIIHDNPEYHNIQIRIVNGNFTNSGSIFFTKLNTKIDYNLTPYEIFDYDLNVEQKQATYNFLASGITNHSIHITSGKPVSVYAFNQSPVPFFDVTNVLPVTALGTEYYQISYTQVSPMSDAYVVVATQNNTVLFHNGYYAATLNKGEVYYSIASDMTGEYINSNNPIAFFAVNQSTIVPYGVSGSSSPLFQQLCPVNTWGKTFFVPVTVLGKEIVRIVASRNNTNITQKGGIIRTDIPGAQTTLTNLQPGQFVELEVRLDSAGCYIQSNNPIGVCSYMGVNSFTGKWANAAQCWIPGIEQTISNSIIAPFVPTYTHSLQHNVLVVSHTVTKHNTMVSINGGLASNLSGGSWYDNVESEMSFYCMPLENPTAAYFFTNPDGIILLGCGTGESGYSRSYYYLAGSAMRDLQATFFANDIPYQLLKENPICESEITFQAEIEGLAPPTVAERIKWYINEAHQPAGFNQETWSRNFSVGEYEIRMWVRYENDDTVSKTGTLVIKSCTQSATFYKNDVHYLTDTTFCNKNVNFRAEIEGLHPTDPESVMWYVDSKDGNGFILENSAINLTEWGRLFENGTYDIKMVVKYDNDETATLIGTLKVHALWIKLRNIRY